MRAQTSHILAVLVAAALAGGCGAQTVAPAPGGRELLQQTDDERRLQGVARELVEQTRGSVTERRAAEFLVARALNGGTQDCMRNAGFEWSPPQLDVQPAFVIEPLGASIWLREPMRPIAAENVVANAPFELAEQAGAEQSYSSEKNAALDACLASGSTEVPSDSELDDYTYPAATAGLDAALNSLVERVEAELPKLQTYEDCMDGAGTSVPDATENGGGYAALQLELQTMAPAPRLVPANLGDPGSAEWVDFRRAEDETLKDDAVCRSVEYHAGMKLLAPLLVEFELANTGALKRADDYWTNILESAIAQGFEE